MGGTPGADDSSTTPIVLQTIRAPGERVEKVVAVLPIISNMPANPVEKFVDSVLAAVFWKLVPQVPVDDPCKVLEKLNTCTRKVLVVLPLGLPVNVDRV